MSCKLIVILLIIFLPGVATAQDEKEKAEILNVVQYFFDSMEKQDSVAFRSVFMRDAYNYIVKESSDTVLFAARKSNVYNVRPEIRLKEKMRSKGVVVQIHQRIAMVWAPYDFWYNDKFSHCGVDVFTMLKTPVGWKIASLAYSIEEEGCE